MALGSKLSFSVAFMRFILNCLGFMVYAFMGLSFIMYSFIVYAISVTKTVNLHLRSFCLYINTLIIYRLCVHAFNVHRACVCDKTLEASATVVGGRGYMGFNNGALHKEEWRGGAFNWKGGGFETFCQD